MQKTILELNQNLLVLGENLLQYLGDLLGTKFRAMAEKFIARISKFFTDLATALEQLKIGKATEIILEFLEEIENLLTDLYSKIDLPLDKVSDVTRQLIQLIKVQVIFLDQKRQSYFSF